jgi:hypothetical protein
VARKPKTFEEAVDAAQHLQGWTHADIAERLDVSLHSVQQWLKPSTSRNARTAPQWACLALHALAYHAPVTERRGALEITYAPVQGRWVRP